MVKEVTGLDTYTGRLEAVDTVEVRPRVNGYVERVAFRDGDYVRKGDLLFVIDPRPYEAAAKQAEGQLAQAQALFVLAEKELDRAKSLITTQAIAPTVLDQRQQNHLGRRHPSPLRLRLWPGRIWILSSRRFARRLQDTSAESSLARAILLRVAIQTQPC